MFKRIVTLALIGSVLNLACLTPTASGQTQKEDARRAERVKSFINKVGTGRDARVEIRLRDKSEVKGYVSEKSNDSFVVTDAETGASATVLYSQIEKVKLTPQLLKQMVKRDFTGKRLAKNLALGFAAFCGVALLVYFVGGAPD
jgi:hypothetical protein